MNSSIGEIARKQERDFISGVTNISKYVTFNISDTINTIEAYLNSKFTSGDTDSLGRPKPFFNIVTAASNIWFRATDIDRRNIRVRATKISDYMNALLASVHIQDWMRRAQFGQYLNDWGRTLARYGSAITEFVESNGLLNISVLPWNRTIIDAVDFDNNPKIKILEFNEQQLRDNPMYDQDAVAALIAEHTTRKTTDGQNKDNKDGYYRLYEVHGRFSREQYKQMRGEKVSDGDDRIFFEQMHVISFVAGEKDDKQKDFTLYSGRKSGRTQVLHHLIPTEGRSLSIGAVEHLFEAQWMTNHSQKVIKDQLDIASKLIFQTSDLNFVGVNALNSIENGDVMIHKMNEPLTQINNGSHDTTQVANFAEVWKRNANEIVGISEAMLGETPKSGTAWRQTEAVLSESHNLFEIMTENKGLALEEMFREFIIPHIKRTQLNSSKEIVADLEAHDIHKIDARFIKNMTTKIMNQRIKEKLIGGQIPTPGEQEDMKTAVESDIKSSLADLGNTRFFKPSEISEKTWKEQFKDLEWDIEIDVTGEVRSSQEQLATLATALKVVASPDYAANKTAQMVVGKILNVTGALSPVEVAQIESATISQQTSAQAPPEQGVAGSVEGLINKQQ